ncbi:MAG: DHH family phosphoesterase [Peptoniphilaceae bacterium]
MEEKYNINDYKTYLMFSLLIILFLLFVKPILGFVCLIIYIYIVYKLYKRINIKNEEIKKYIENIKDDFDSITKQVIFKMPFPIVLLDENKKILWYNTEFINMVSEDIDVNNNLEEILPDLDIDSVISGENLEVIDLSLGEKNYQVHHKIVDVEKSSSQNNKIIMFYFVDNSDYSHLREKYILENPIVAKIEVDNFDDAIDSTPTANKPLLIAEIDSTIIDYFKDFNALVRKYDNDKYLIIMSFGSLKQIKEKKFDLLDDLRELDKGNKIPITLSVGVSSFGLSFKEANKESDTCVDLALGRGGDQAVIKVEDNYEFFGGKSKAVEKRNKVKARVLGIALKQLIDGASDVFIMGHKNADMDAIGAAIGVLRAVMNREKKGYIVLNKSNPSIDNLLNRMKEEEEEIYKNIIKEDYAKTIIGQRSLVILVDNHKPSFAEAPSLIDLVSQVVIIDHHRRGKEIVDKPVLSYIEPYASSTCELVTEMLTYMNDELNLTHFEADALMSGIVVDTKNFSLQTGVRTFEAASILRRAGADMIKVKQLFQDDLDTMLNRAEVIHNTKIIFEEFAISRLEKEAENSILISAQAADEILDINGVNASFVMTRISEGVHISGRSRGNISVQLILEKIGGGGHLNMAGTRLDVKNLDEAESILVNAIETYLNEEKEDE